MPSGTIVSGSHQVEAEAETYPRGLTLVGVPLGTWETSPLECTKLLLHALTRSMHSKGQETSPTISGISALLPSFNLQFTLYPLRFTNLTLFRPDWKHK